MKDENNAIERMRASGSLTDSECDAANQLQQILIARSLTPNFIVRPPSLIDNTKWRRDFELEKLNAIEIADALDEWRAKCRKSFKLIVEMIIFGREFVKIAGRHNVNYRAARKQLKLALGAWIMVREKFLLHLQQHGV